mgnify:CR=1 FL=1
MAGGKSTPKKDKKLKASAGAKVITGSILVRGLDTYKAGINVKGRGTLYAACDGTVFFTHRKAPRGTVKTYINVKA